MKRLSQLALFAILGQVVLLASAWLLPLVSEYRLVGDNISELALARWGFILTVALALSGLGVVGLAYVIRRLTAGSRGSLVGSLLIGIYGAGAVIVAIFPTDRIDSPADVWSQSTAGWIHSLTRVGQLSRCHRRHVGSDLDLRALSALAVAHCVVVSSGRRGAGLAVRAVGGTLGRNHATPVDYCHLGLADSGWAPCPHNRLRAGDGWG